MKTSKPAENRSEAGAGCFPVTIWHTGSLFGYRTRGYPCAALENPWHHREGAVSRNSHTMDY